MIRFLTSGIAGSSLWTADVATHIKIVSVALVAAILVVAIGISARISDPDTTSIPANSQAPLVVKAGQPAIFTANDTSTIR